MRKLIETSDKNYIFGQLGLSAYISMVRSSKWCLHYGIFTLYSERLMVKESDKGNLLSLPPSTLPSTPPLLINPLFYFTI